MEFGVSKNRQFFYKNSVAIIFLTFVFILISVDSVNRYFTLVKLEDLENSQSYGILRITLFLFLISSVFFDKKNTNVKSLYILNLYSLICFVSILINSSTIEELIKSFIYSFSFVLIFRYGILLSYSNLNIQPFIKSILVLSIILLFKFFNIYIFNFSSIYIISNDAIFSLVAFVPFLFLLKNKKIMLTILILIVVCTFFSQKRSVIIFVNLSLILAALLYLVKVSITKTIIISIVFFLTVFINLDKLMNINFVNLAFNRFVNSEDNGRNDVLNKSLTQFYDGNYLNTIFGYGYSASIKKNGLPIHNDFIEILYDFGILSFLVYILAIIIIGSKCIIWFKKRHLYMDYYLSYVVAYVILVGLSILNSMIFSTYTIVLFLSLGISYGFISLKTKK